MLERNLDRGKDHTTSITLTPVEGMGEPAEEEIVVDIDDIPPGAGVLVVKRGSNSGARFVLDKNLTSLGRAPDSDIFLDDVTVSRRHAEIRASHSGYVVHDVGSLNGTYLNRKRIEEETKIDNGDELQVGKFRLVFLAGVQGS